VGALVVVELQDAGDRLEDALGGSSSGPTTSGTSPSSAATGLWAATALELLDRGGVYCEDCSVKGVVPDDHADLGTGGVKNWAIDVDAAERLWAVSVAAIGLDPLG